MNRITIFLVFLFVAVGKSNGQCSFACADKFENVWVVKNSEIVCFDKQLKKVGTYSNIMLGQPYYIDALDPFRVLVFYQSSQSIALLNNAVSEIAKPISLRDKGISDASLVCRSSKGGIWVFDRVNWEILYFDSGINKTGERLIPDMVYSGSTPQFMIENKGVLYVAFKGKGICRFDSFGARLGDILIKVDDFFTFIEGQIAYKFEGQLFKYSLETNQKKLFKIDFSCIPVSVQGNYLYFDGSGLVVGKIR